MYDRGGENLNKLHVSVTTIFFCLALIFGASSNVVGDAEVPEWKKGDEWVYEMAMTTTFEGTTIEMKIESTMEVKQLTTINVNGTNHDVYDMEIDMKMSIGGITSTGTSHQYFRRSDLAVVKYVNEEGSESFYDPPKKDLDFPLSIGKTWTCTYTDCEYDEEWDMWFNYTYIDVNTVEKKETVSVGAGKYECYKIRSQCEEDSEVSYVWYSPEAKNVVKYSSPDGTGVMELTSSTYEQKEEDFFLFRSLFGIPIFLILILIIIVAILVVALAVRRSKSKSRQVAAKSWQASSIPQAPTSTVSWKSTPAAQRTTSSARTPTTKSPSPRRATTRPISSASKPKAAPSATVPAKPKAARPTATPTKPKATRPPAAPPPPPPKHPCPFCGQQLSFIGDYNEWYCFDCEKYPFIE